LPNLIYEAVDHVSPLPKWRCMRHSR
jgi:hypothetical protein